MPEILVINPNSSEKMTGLIQEIVRKMHLPPTTSVTFFTAPTTAPPSLNSPEDAEKSAEACIDEITELSRTHDAFLVACFSPNHPLIGMLRERLSGDKIVTGVFEESIHYGRRTYGQDWGIITTGSTWGDAIAKHLEKEKYWGTVACGVHAGDLDKKEAQDKVEKAVRKLAEKKTGAIILGCVGFGELGKVVEFVGEGRLRVVDSIKAGVGGVVGMLLAGENYNHNQ